MESVFMASTSVRYHKDNLALMVRHPGESRGTSPRARPGTPLAPPRNGDVELHFSFLK
jgi:hypothetical protein